jgi:hypothetical protein
MKLRIRPEAARELRVAAKWYEDQRADLRARLLDAVAAALDAIRESPRAFPVLDDDADIQSAPVERFPYRVVYLVDGDLVQCSRLRTREGALGIGDGG